jgi:hypothetical protein
MLQGDPEETDRRKGFFRIVKEGCKKHFQQELKGEKS